MRWQNRKTKPILTYELMERPQHPTQKEIDHEKIHVIIQKSFYNTHPLHNDGSRLR